MYVCSLKLNPMGMALNNGRSVEELQRVIQSMKRVVEKLQMENEKLRKTQGRGRGRGDGRRGAGSGGGGEGGGGEGKRGGGGEEGRRGGVGVGEQMEEKERRVKEKEETVEEEEEGKREEGVIKSPLVKIADEYEKLRSSFSREMETTQKLSVALRAAEVQNRRLKEEVCYIRWRERERAGRGGGGKYM